MPWKLNGLYPTIRVSLNRHWRNNNETADAATFQSAPAMFHRCACLRCCLGIWLLRPPAAWHLSTALIRIGTRWWHHHYPSVSPAVTMSVLLYATLAAMQLWEGEGGCFRFQYSAGWKRWAIVFLIIGGFSQSQIWVWGLAGDPADGIKPIGHYIKTIPKTRKWYYCISHEHQQQPFLFFATRETLISRISTSTTWGLRNWE